MKKDTYLTADLALVACLLIRGCEISFVHCASKNKVLFELKKTPQLEDVVSAYFNYACQVDALSYFNRLKSLKSQIYSKLIANSQ